ncbi:TetR family transcriptional regulator [Actinocrinis puniceicyclus]|uniref:TetR family transcriptional regulator n=1 Tax=Actinocrinis puniceicyclus TaxID=977794 RepID=A0A8J8BBC0_9ACTN|nr:TetR/AcrR family transcriptional regulator [Actinocrinis puniceicyclus]MBS2961926.1 TetR family transcriptional regulator [Actinocrinis puniceicyclus]
MPRTPLKALPAPAPELARLPVQERLLAASLRLFAAQGVEGTSVQEIVAAAGVTKGAMYHYFASKDDLLYEIYHRLLSRQTERLNAIADGPGSARERVRAAAADVVESTLDSIDEAIVSFRSVHMLPNPQRAQVRAERRRYHERFRELVEEGQRDGAFRDDVPADLAVHFFFGSVNQLGTWYHRDGGLTRQQIAEQYARLFLAGLGAR